MYLKDALPKTRKMPTRFSSYLKNLGLLTQDSAYALRAVGFSQIAEGEILSFGSLFSEIKKLLFKFETSYDRA